MSNASNGGTAAKRSTATKRRAPARKTAKSAPSKAPSKPLLDPDEIAEEARKVADDQYETSKKVLAEARENISVQLEAEKEVAEMVNKGIASAIEHSIAINAKWAEFYHDTIRERIAVSAKILQLQEPGDRLELELEFARAAFQSYIDLTQELAEETRVAIEKAWEQVSKVATRK